MRAMQTSVFLSLGGLFLLAGCAGNLGEGVQQVGNVRWNKEAAQTHDAPPAADKARIYFLRRASNDDVHTSANVAINDRFQTSLQPGNYSETDTCVGLNRISVNITGLKTNDLLLNAADYALQGGQEYYFDVDVNQSGQAHISQLSAEQALAMMQGLSRQNHQVSRVVPDCNPPADKISVQLQVLFDTDKSFVKEQYYPEIGRVADYLNRFPDAVVMLEGFTDDRASEQYNISLSQRRVDAVRDVLVRQFGIAPYRVAAFGYGESMPVADNSTEEGRRLNRRVIAVFGTK